jgi:hypothetical protein
LYQTSTITNMTGGSPCATCSARHKGGHLDGVGGGRSPP